MGRKKPSQVSRSGRGEQIPEDLVAILAWCRKVIQTIWTLTWPDAGPALVKARDSLIDLLVAAPEVDDITCPHKREWARLNWTDLDENAYHRLIAQPRECLADGEPMWHLERYWTGTAS